MSEKKAEGDQPNLDAHRFIEEKFKDYRNSGIAFSVTLITLSSALLVWSKDMWPAPTHPCALGAQMILPVVTIFACPLIQFANYQGYKHEARFHLGQSTFPKATCWFTCEDYVVTASVVFFALGFVCSAYLFVARQQRASAAARAISFLQCARQSDTF